MADSTEEKQNFLREKILDKGYDTNQFVQFLINKKGQNGADIAVWTMNDLKVVVKEFIKLNGGQIEEEIHKPEQKPEKKEVKPPKKISMFDVLGDSKPKSQPQPQKPKIEPPKTQTKIEAAVQSNNISNTYSNSTKNTNISTSLTGDESEYGIVIEEGKKCKPCEITGLSKIQNLSINLSKPEKKEGGFLKKDYITYLISTLPVSYKVRRRYSDFSWLRNALQMHFPGNVIPPIPKSSGFGVDSFSEQFVSKRLRGLEKFLNYLTKDPVIKNSNLLFDFLYIGSEVDFNSKKKVYENVKPVSEVQEFREENGKLKLLITGEKEGYLENIKDNINININLFKKLNVSLKSLFDEINAVITRMDEISSTWEQVYKASEIYYDDKITCETYRQMSNLFKTWSTILKEQNDIIHVDVREHFKYVRKNFGSMKDLANSIENYKNNYQKNVKYLMNKKDDLFKKGEPSKWEFESKSGIDFSLIAKDKKTALSKMCHKETLNTINIKEFYGYYLNRTINEYERMRRINGILNKEIITSKTNKLIEISSKFYTCVAEINSALNSAILDKSNDQKCKLKRIPLDENLLK